MRTEVSIIVPAYNAGKYIEKCLYSLLLQTMKDIEIVIIDDGSKDDTGYICKKLASEDTRIKYIFQENAGTTAARKAGILVAEGRYITFSDADDYVDPDYCEKLYGTAMASEADVVISVALEEGRDCGRYQKSSVAAGIYEGRELWDRLICGESFFEWCVFPSLWAKMFKCENLKKYQEAVDDRINIGDDGAVVYPMLSETKNVVFTNYCGYHYVQHEGSIVRSFKNRNWSDYELLYRHINKYFQLTGSKILEEQLEKYILDLGVPRCFQEFTFDNLFPFEKVKKGSRIAIYGAGVYGRNIVDYVEKSGFCEISGIYDSNFGGYQQTWPAVKNPEYIVSDCFDYVIMPVMSERARKSIRKYLLSKGIADDRIIGIDYEKCRRIIKR